MTKNIELQTTPKKSVSACFSCALGRVSFDLDYVQSLQLGALNDTAEILKDVCLNDAVGANRTA